MLTKHWKVFANGKLLSNRQKDKTIKTKALLITIMQY